jgi:Eukaryotic protein of unknown function (DUF829)
MWHELGLECSIIRPTLLESLWPPLADALAWRACTEMKAASAECNIVHCFSNGGFLAFSNTMRLQLAATGKSSTVKQPANRLATLSMDASNSWPADVPTATRHSSAAMLSAVIFDSSPGIITADIAARCDDQLMVLLCMGWAKFVDTWYATVTSATKMDDTVCRATLSVIFRQAPDSMTKDGPAPLLKHGLEAFFRWFLELRPISERTRSIWQLWEQSAPTTPQLYLNSAADSIVILSQIQAFQNAQVGFPKPMPWPVL